jgi:DNA primase
MNPGQPALIASAIQKMQPGARIILAMDNDEAGRDLAAQIEALARETEAEDLVILRHLPEGEGMDWNDCLKASGQSRPPEPAGP